MERLRAATFRRSYAQGDRIFTQGDKGDAVYCVVSGRVQIDAVSVDGREIFLNEVNPGDCFGEIAVIDGSPRTAGARATKRPVLLALHRDAFLQVLNDEGELSGRLLHLFCTRMRWSTDLYEDTAFLTSPARLARRILSLAAVRRCQTNTEIKLRVSQSELARFLGISRKQVNEHLNRWKRAGWVATARSCLHISNFEALRRVADCRDDPKHETHET